MGQVSSLLPDVGQVSSLIWPWTVPTVPSRIVETSKGKVQGKAFMLEDGRSVEAYLGIPFAKPPLGELRFKKPEPPEPWDGVKDCTRFGPRCPHEDISVERFTVFHPKGEDCLTLNVFAPTWAPLEDQPDGFAVMVFVHGGGFAVHSAAHYGDHGICRNLCTRDVVVVTLQYRLGFFGFLSTADENAPGNFGLWDQTLALKWVHENITKFGGNPKNVTVFGQSAGGASTDLLSLSPHSRDLFHKMIPMAGTALCTFAMNDADHVRNTCMDFAIQSGFIPDTKASRSEQNASMVEFFRQMPTQSIELSLLGKRGFNVNRHGTLDLTPVVDGDFFPKPLEELRLESPSKIVMTGVTEHESLLFAAIRPPSGSLREEVHKVISKEFERKHVAEASERLKDAVFDTYFKPVDPRDRRQVAEACIKAGSDVFINNGVWDFADTMARLGHKTYLYCFEYFNPFGFGLAGLLFPFKGATHCSELPYLFRKGIIAYFYPNEDDLRMSDEFSTYFTNFAKYGNPNGCEGKCEERWQPLDETNTSKYFAIRLNNSQMRDSFCGGRPAEWRKLLRQAKRQKLIEKDECRQELDRPSKEHATPQNVRYVTA